MGGSYLELSRDELQQRVDKAEALLEECSLCPRACGAHRCWGDQGPCLTGDKARVDSYGPHHGEEKPIRGRRGSGTIFFSGCNLQCVFCQNYDTSRAEAGELVESDELAGIMLDLQGQGCHNINLVSPTHVVPQVLASLARAIEDGLTLPLVYNTGGYDAVNTLRVLDGIVDIYMPDMKYQEEETGRRLSRVPEYPAINRAAIKEMHRQVGDLTLDEDGIATRGLLVRHLVLPGELAGTREAMEFLAEEVSKDTYVNLMAQYYPAYRAGEYPPLDRPLTRNEFRQAIRAAREAGIHRIHGLIQRG